MTQSTTVSAICGSASDFQAAEELWADLVPRREEKEIEKHRLDERWNLDVELPDQDSRQKTADDDAEAEKLPNFTRPIRKPIASVRKMASSGFRRSAETM